MIPLGGGYLLVFDGVCKIRSKTVLILHLGLLWGYVNLPGKKELVLLFVVACLFVLVFCGGA